MNAKQLIATVVAIAAASSVFAQTAAPAAGLTRAEVTAEFLRARANGEVIYNEADMAKFPVSTSNLTRPQVTAEYRRARANGEIADNQADMAKLPASASNMTHEQVIAEFYAARKNGQIPQTEADFDVAHAARNIGK